MKSPRTILIAVDYSPCSLAALRTAHRLYAESGSSLHAIHVMNSRGLGQVISAIPLPKNEVIEQLESQGEKRLRETVISELGDESIAVHGAVGHPLDSVLKKVDELNADLLVMGAFGDGGPGRGASAFSTKCTRRCPTNVLLVHDEMPSPMRSLIACIDFSDYASDVAREAASLAARENATLTLIHAHSNPFETYDWGKFNINLSAQYELYKRALKAKLEELKAQLVSEHAGLDVQTELIFGADYTGAVVDRINAGEVDLVVMGAKGKSKLAYMLLGSTAEKVLRNTKSSVLTVRVS